MCWTWFPTSASIPASYDNVTKKLCHQLLALNLRKTVPGVGGGGRNEVEHLDLVPNIRKHPGIILGEIDGEVICVPEKTRFNGNLAVYGASGSKKTRAFCVNMILQSVARKSSLVICDPKSELYEKTSEYLRDQGYTVKVFNLVTPSASDSWNCLSEIEGQELMAQLPFRWSWIKGGRPPRWCGRPPSSPVPHRGQELSTNSFRRFNGNLAVYGASGSKKTRAFCVNMILQSVAPWPGG